MFGITGGGGKCTFDNGLGSFEKIVGETAMGVTGLAQALDGASHGALGLTLERKAIASTAICVVASIIIASL